MRVDLEAGALEPCDRESQERGVLEHATAQGDTIQPGAVTQTARRSLDDHVGQRRVEAAANLAGRPTPRADPRRPRGTGPCVRTTNPAHASPAGCRRVARVGLRCRQRLQLHGGLGLEVDAVAKPEKARDGIEQPAGARRRRRVETPLDGRTVRMRHAVRSRRRMKSRSSSVHGHAVRGAAGRPPPCARARGPRPRRPAAARLEVTDPLESNEIGDAGIHRPTHCRRCRSRCRPTRPRSPGRPCRCPRGSSRCARDGAARRRGPRPRAISAYAVERYPGWRSWATTVGSSSSSRSKCWTIPSHARHARSSPRSPRCWLKNTSRSTDQREDVLELPADGQDRPPRRRAARRSRAAHSPARASGATGAPPITRAIESSHRTWMGRSWPRKTSAIPCSRASASPSSMAIGSSRRFPLVMTSGTPTASRRR